MTNLKIIWQKELSVIKQTKAVKILEYVDIWEAGSFPVKFFILDTT